MGKSHKDVRLATMVARGTGGRTTIRWELLRDGRERLLAAEEVLVQLAAGLPERQDLAGLAEEIRTVVRDYSPPPPPAAAARAGRQRPRRDDQALPRAIASLCMRG